MNETPFISLDEESVPNTPTTVNQNVENTVSQSPIRSRTREDSWISKGLEDLRNYEKDEVIFEIIRYFETYFL
jgi:hypothetical protein